MQFLGQEDPLEKEMTTQYSCQENSVDRGAWWATADRAHGVGRDSVTKPPCLGLNQHHIFFNKYHKIKENNWKFTNLISL